MSKNLRDATASAKGYDYQMCYLMYLIVSNINNASYSFIYEGNEDIDVYINDRLHTLIQVKYHSSLENSVNEKLDTDGGLTKVYKNFVKKYQTLKSISQIKYSITNEEKCKLITSPKSYELCIKGEGNIYNILKDRKEYDEDNDILKHFCSLLKFEFISDKSVNLLIEEISKMIETTYFYTKMNTNLKAQYKTEYLLSLLHKYVRNIIYASTKHPLQIKNLVDSIHKDISNNYTEDMLINEIILLLNSNKSPISPLLTNRIVDVCIADKNLVNEYKLLKLNIENSETLQRLQSDIHKKSISLFNQLLNDRGESLNSIEKKKITHSIAHILNSKHYTSNMNKRLKEYYSKVSI
jgi:hypothetical protein